MTDIEKGPLGSVKYRIGLVILTQFIAIALVGIKQDWAFGVSIFTPVVAGVAIYAIFVPFVKNQTIVTQVVLELRNEADVLVRYVYVFGASMIVAVFLFV